MVDAFKDIEKFEADLWEAADNLRANSKLTSSDYFMPVLGVIFLRHAANRFDAAARQIGEDQASGRMPKRKIVPADYHRRRALFLPEKARYDWIMKQAATSGSDLPKLVTEAMNAIEAGFEPLQGVLPKDYGIFETKVLEDLMRLFNSEQIKQATGDVFGRIYEYFLAKFSIQKAHDNGEFFTPSSLVQTIVNVIEPNHGIVSDLACGSGGMFVQSSHFIEHEGGDTAKKVVFYGQEKNRDTIRLAKMNLAVHGLEGKIAEAITYYQDEHTLVGKCDFVMANPPFNVDLVDAERIKLDPRLPFGLPGVNKEKKVGNGNYLWISYFWSYLNEKGRAGFVMSSQASSAGHGEKEVRRKIIETGDVDAMISIRSNFFYTRTVPCELWFIDRGKPDRPSSLALLPEGEGKDTRHYRGGYDFSGLVERARELRQKQTPAEDPFWALVRDQKFLGLKFRRQHQFGDYILDFYCHEQRLAVEFDGKIHETRRAKDKKRDAYLSTQGVKVIRIPNEMILSDPESTLKYLHTKLSFPADPPLPVGEGRGEGDVAKNHRGNILMMDARNIYRKVTRKIYDFSPEQMKNLSAIVWLYRGQQVRFLALIKDYLSAVCAESAAIPDKLAIFEKPLADLRGRFTGMVDAIKKDATISADKKKAFLTAFSELTDAEKPYEKDRTRLLADLDSFQKRYPPSSPLPVGEGAGVREVNQTLNVARKAFDPIAERIKGLIKQVDLLYKLTARMVEVVGNHPLPLGEGRGVRGVNQTLGEGRGVRGVNQTLGEGQGEGEPKANGRVIRRLVKQLDEERKTAVEQLKRATYFHRQMVWLQDRFPKAELVNVPGLVKLVDRKAIEAADWSLTPGRYVGVAPPEEDEDFDFEQTIRDIHIELADLNKEAAELAAKIQKNFDQLGI